MPSRQPTGRSQCHAAPNSSSKKMIGIQIGAVSFVDEGVEKVLDECEKSAAVNTLFVATFTYGRGIAGRQVPGQPLPDHGKQKYDTDTFFGGSYTKIHPKYYTEHRLQRFSCARPRRLRRARAGDSRSEETRHEDDLLVRGRLPPRPAQCREAAGGRAFRQESRHSLLQQSRLSQLAAGHRRRLVALLRHRRHHVGIRTAGRVLECARRQPRSSTTIDSYLLLRVLLRKSTNRAGINPDRAKTGFLELEKFVLAARKGTRPVDGYYVELWRLMLRYPELLAWEILWTSSLRETQKAIYDKVKSVKPQLGVGWHIWHNNSFNPIYRAEQDLAEMAPYSDFLKL